MKQITLFLVGVILVTVLTFITCCKKQSHCDPSSKGRIIGYDPCRHYTTATSSVQGLGFVIEIDNDTFKDTVVTYEIPNGLFQFPYIDDFAATNGQFLFASDIQDKLLIKYRLALESEKTAVLCKANIYIAPFNTAVKGKEIFISCVSGQ
jgi:hypothetical protein